VSPVTQIPAALGPFAGKAVTAVAATDIFTSTAHGLLAGDSVQFSALTGGAGITPGQTYYVIAANLAANTFQVSATLGGAALDVTVDLTAGTVTQILNWGNLKRLLTNEQLSYLAKYFQTISPVAGITDGTIVDNVVVRQFYQSGNLPA
jgi:hypothetical protein